MGENMSIEIPIDIVKAEHGEATHYPDGQGNFRICQGPAMSKPLLCRPERISSGVMKSNSPSLWASNCCWSSSSPSRKWQYFFNNLSKLSAKTGFSVVWHYTYNGENYTYCCDLTD